MDRISCSSQISKTFSPVNLVETTKTLHAHLSDGILVRFILMLYYPSYFLDRWLPSSDQPSQHATWWIPNANQIDKLYSDTHPENKRNLVSNHKKFDVTSPQKSQLFSCNNWKVIFESFERIGVRSALTARDVCERFLSVRLRIFWLCSLVDLFEDVLERTTLGVIVATNRNEDKLSYLSAVLQELVTVRSKLESKIWDTSAYNQSVDEKVNKTSSDLQSSAIVNDAKADGSLYQDGSHCAVERNSCMEAHNGRSNENEQVNQLERSFATPLSTPHLVAEALMKHVKDSHPVIENKKDSGEMRDARVSICSQETRASSSITEPSLLSTQTFVPIQIDVGEKFKDADRFNVTHIPSFSCTKTTSPEGHVHRCEIKEDYTLQMDMKEEMNKQENPEKLDALLLHCDDTEEKESAIKKSILQVPEKLNSVERHDALLSLYEELKNDRFLNEGKHLHLLSDLLNHSLESVNSNVNDSHNVLSSSIHSTSLPNLKKYLNHKMTSHAHTSNSIDPVTLTQLLQSVENLKQNDIELESEKHSENVVHKLLRENFALRAQLVSVQRFHQNGTSSKVYRSNRYAPTPTHAVEGIPKEMASAENKIQDISETIRDEKYLTPISSDTMTKKSSSGQENNVSQTLCCKKGYGEVTSPSIEKANKKYEYDAMDPICSKNQPSYLSGKSSARRNHKQDGSKMSNSPKLHADPKSNARKQVEMKEGTSVEQNPSIFDTSMTKMCTDDQASSSDASNIQRVRRVLVNVCLTGDSSRVQRNTVLGVLDGISEADITAQVLILLKSCESEKGTNDERTKYKFRGLYLYSPSKEHLRRCYGSGPLTVLTRAVSPHAGMLDSVMVQDLLCFDPQERNFIRIPEGNETANKKCVFYSVDAFLVPES